jgi:hypothetical protein
MITALYISLAIGLWAYLFTMPLSEPGQVFGWLRGVLSRLPDWAFNPLIGCAKCHAGQVAFWRQVWSVTHGDGFDIPFILIAIGGAYFLQTWHQIVEKYLHK